MIGGMGDGKEASGFGDGFTEGLGVSRDVVSSFRGTGFELREDDCFRGMTGDEAERETLPGRPLTMAPGVALTLRTPNAPPVKLPYDGSFAEPLAFDSLLCELSCAPVRPLGTLSPKPLGKGGISSSRGEAGRMGIEPSSEVSACI